MSRWPFAGGGIRGILGGMRAVPRHLQANSRRFLPDARRRMEELKGREFFGFLLLADPRFAAWMVRARDALAQEDGLGALEALIKAERLYEGVAWHPQGPDDRE